MSTEVVSSQRTDSFTLIRNYVLDHYTLCAEELALYVAIARHINQQSGLAWPSYRRLMKVTGLARATVAKYLKSLEYKRLIAIIRRCRAGTKARAVNLYRLLDPREPVTGSLPPVDEAALPPAVRAVNDPGSPDELPLVHGVNYPSSPNEPSVVHAADGNQTSLNKTQTNPTESNQRGSARCAEAVDGAVQTTAEPTSGSALQPKQPSLKGKKSWNHFCRSLAETCKLDFEANQGKIRKFASLLWQHGQGFTADDLKTFEAWWYKNDWRGQRGDIPRLDEVVQMIRIAVEADEIFAERTAQSRYDYISGDLAAFIEY